MKKSILVFLLGMVLAFSAQAESAMEICTAEARDAGIEDQAEFQQYVSECTAQVSSEMQDVEQEVHESAEEVTPAEES